MNRKKKGIDRRLLWSFLIVLFLFGQEYIFGALFVTTYMFRSMPKNDDIVFAQNDLPRPALRGEGETPETNIVSEVPAPLTLDHSPPNVDRVEIHSPPKPSISAYSLQVASVANHDAAVKFAEKLKAKGYEAHVVTGEVGGKKVYRVRLQGFASYKEAESARNKFEREEGARGLIIAQQS